VTDLLTGIPFRDGPTYVHERDGVRLAAQHQRVLDVMKDGRPHTLAEISKLTGDPEASVSARCRDLRKARFGSHTIVREYVKDGLHTYRLVM
jgi:hypothetical protein